MIRPQWATFGGDLDNFSFPRFAIDAAFIRRYEDGQPVSTAIHFEWNADRPVEGTPVFVSGSPGSTQRLLIRDQLMTLRDVILPMDQLIASELRGRRIRFSQKSDENAFIAAAPISSVGNTLKRGLGRMRALTDADFVDRLAGQETVFRRQVVENERCRTRSAIPGRLLDELDVE